MESILVPDEVEDMVVETSEQVCVCVCVCACVCLSGVRLGLIKG